MKIEKLNENKIRITLDINDLAEKNIDFHEFMSNPIDSQALFLDVLEQAEKEVGFVTKDCKIMLEAIVTSDCNFILTVTRVKSENDKENIIPRRRIKVKRKTTNITSDTCAIFEFASFDNFCDYGMSLTSSSINNINKSIGISKLYLYNSKYYLIIDKIVSDIDFVKNFCASILEFGKLVSNSHTYKNQIMEHGKVLIKKDAVLACSVGFKK